MLQPIRRLLTGFAALLFGLLAVAGAARPAAASHEICFKLHDTNGNVIVICLPLEFDEAFAELVNQTPIDR